MGYYATLTPDTFTKGNKTALLYCTNSGWAVEFCHGNPERRLLSFGDKEYARYDDALAAAVNYVESLPQSN